MNKYLFWHKLNKRRSGNLLFYLLVKYYVLVNHCSKNSKGKKSYSSGVGWQIHAWLYKFGAWMQLMLSHMWAGIVMCFQWPSSLDSTDTLFQPLLFTRQDCCYNLYHFSWSQAVFLISPPKAIPVYYWDDPLKIVFLLCFKIKEKAHS